MIVCSDFMHARLRCVVILTAAGHYCGYVGVGPKHPLFCWPYEMIEIETEIDVHGGITYSGGSHHGMSKKEIEYIETKIHECETERDDNNQLYLMYFAGVYQRRLAHIKDNMGKPTNYPVPTNDSSEELWWFGFDCAHYDDTPEECDKNFTEYECIKLADQLASL